MAYSPDKTRGVVLGNKREVLEELAASESKFVRNVRATVNAYLAPLRESRVLASPEHAAIFRRCVAATGRRAAGRRARGWREGRPDLGGGATQTGPWAPTPLLFAADRSRPLLTRPSPLPPPGRPPPPPPPTTNPPFSRRPQP